ncbi:MAG: DinB family protein [Sphingobacteriales bacterium]
MEDIIQNLAEVIDNFLKIEQQSIDWDFKIREEKWSKKEIIGHLIDSAQVNLQRFVRCTYEQDFKLVYAQDEWVTAAHYQNADIKEVLDLWILLNRQIIRVLINYPENRLETTCDIGKTEVQLHSVNWLAEDYVRHLQHHLQQITQF